MTDSSDLARLVAQADPVHDLQKVAAGHDLRDSLLAVIDERSEGMAHADRTERVDRPLAHMRPAVAFAATVLATLVVVGASTLLFTGSTPEEEPPDIAPATAPPESSTVTTSADAEAEAVAPDPRVTWEAIDPGVSADSEGGVAAVGVGDGRVVVSGSHWSEGGEVGEVWYSDDLVVWTRASVEQPPPEDEVWINALAYGPDGWVAAGNNMYGGAGTFWYSEDGTEWTLGTLDTPPARSGWGVDAITAGGPGWVAVGNLQRDGRIWVSTDGRHWDTIALPEFAEVWFHDVSVDDGLVTVVGRPNDQRDTVETPGDDVVAMRWVSEDGLTWTPLPFQEDPVGPETHTISIDPATGKHVALNKYGVWVSDDGIEWVEVASSNGIPPYTHPSQEVVWMGGTMVGGSRDFIYESSDGGATWLRTGPTDLEYAHPRRLFSVGGKVILLSRTDIWIGTLE